MTDKLPAYAFAGSATSAAANIEENLLEWLPDSCILIVPDRVAKGSPLKDLVRWLEDTYEDDDLLRTDDLVQALATPGLAEDNSLQLCLLYDPDSAEDRNLVRAAYEHEIPVHDICNGMYAIPLPEEGTSEAELPQEATLLRGEADTSEDPPWLPDEYHTAAQGAVSAFPEGAVTGTPSLVQLQDEHTLTRNILEGIRALIREELAGMGLTPGVNKPPVINREDLGEIIEDSGVQGAPAFLPAPDYPPLMAPPLPADATTRRYTRDAEGIHRPRTRGRLRAGLVQVELTDAEAEALRADGKLTD